MPYLIYIYTLLLEDGYYYVGRTKDWERRRGEHFNKKGSEWTKLHPPLEVLSTETFLVSSQEEEDRWENHQTIKMMKERGWQKVRGGFWCICGEMETLLGIHHHGYFIDIDIEDVTLQSREQTVYVLKLQQDKYFVGGTRSLLLAVKRHEKGKSCSWTQKYPPVELIYQQTVVYENGFLNQDVLNDLVIEYGEKYGYENIRGGNFNQIDEEKHLCHIASFIRKKKNGGNATTTEPLLLEYENVNGELDSDVNLYQGEALYFVYVLELKDGFYHISCVRDVDRILRKIRLGKGGQWCTLHPPVKLVEVIPIIGSEKCADIEQVDPIVERYFNIYGAEKVRGGRFVFIDTENHLKKVHEQYRIADGIFNGLKKSGHI